MNNDDNPLKGYEGNMSGALKKTLNYNPKSKQQVMKNWICKRCRMNVKSIHKPLEEGCVIGEHDWIMEG